MMYLDRNSKNKLEFKTNTVKSYQKVYFLIAFCRLPKFTILSI